MISRVRGTRDILDTNGFDNVYQALQKHLKKYRFQEIIVPIIEYTDLFKRALGNETDVVSKEMFLVSSSSQDKDTSESASMCLRPEATASVVRAFIENGVQDMPWKVFTFGPMFRYERPQKGRFREFFQCSMEVIGSACYAQDVAVIEMLHAFFQDVCGLTEYALHINYLGCYDDRIAFKKVLQTFLENHTDLLCKTCLQRKDTNPLRIFDCKSEQCHKLYQTAPRLTDALCRICADEWQQVQHRLQELSVSYVHSTTLVRGLDYYNKTIFEFVSPLLGAQSAFCGGGRYDSLVALLGGKQDQPSIGAAIGIDRLLLLLEVVQSPLLVAYQESLIIILPLSQEQQPLALYLGQFLRHHKKCVDILFDGSLKSMMRKAHKLGARKVLLIGEDEQAQGTVTIKDMVTGDAQTVAQAGLLEYI